MGKTWEPGRERLFCEANDRLEYVDNRFLALGDFTEASVLRGGRTARLSIEGVSGETAGEAMLGETRDLCSAKPS